MVQTFLRKNLYLHKGFYISVFLLLLLASSAQAQRTYPRDAENNYVHTYDPLAVQHYSVGNATADSITFSPAIQKICILTEDEPVYVTFDGTTADSESFKVPAGVIFTNDDLDLTEFNFYNPAAGGGSTDFFVQPWRRRK